MDREQMNAKLNRKDITGIGVECVCSTGEKVYYFYENFTKENDGIKRAMKQLYPLMDNGKIKGITFIEQRHNV